MKALKQLGFSYGNLANLFGISRQRVHQITSGYGKLLKANNYYSKLRQEILGRDSYRCQICGGVYNLLVHHIDNNDDNNQSANLLVLCNNCHLDLHRPTKGHFGRKHLPLQLSLRHLLRRIYLPSININSLKQSFVGISRNHKFYSVTQTSKILGKDSKTVYYHIRVGHLQTIKKYGMVLVTGESINAFLKK